MKQPRQDDARLQDLIKDVSGADAKNSENFDKAILTLSSGALTLSLAFTKDIVSPATAEYNFLLYASWVLFMLALAVNVAGFMRAFSNARKLRRLLFDALRHGTKPEELVQPMMDDHVNEIYRVHFWQGALFLMAAAAFTIYVMLNFHHEATMTKTRNDPPKIERAQPSASFFAQAVKPAQVVTTAPAPATPAASASASAAVPASSTAPSPAAPAASTSAPSAQTPAQPASHKD
jgi:hypothetical protein